MIKQKIKTIKSCMEDKLRHLCGGLSPAGRLITICSLLGFFGIMSLWTVVSAIFNIGRYSAPINVEHINKAVIIQPNDSLKIKILKQHFYEHKDSTENNDE